MKYGVDRGRWGRTRPWASYPAAVSVLAVVVSVAVGCTQGSPAAPAPTANSPEAAPGPTVASQIDPRWMGLGTTALWNWQLLDRQITPDFQQFGLRPLNSEEVPRRGCGCGNGDEAATAVLTAFAPGKFDPTEAWTDQSVDVNGREGFFRPSVDVEDAVLSWPYADDAWATIRGRSSDTSELDVMVALASDLRPTERTPVRLPLSLTKAPVDMPLSSIQVQHGHWPTIVRFNACPPYTPGVPAPECASTAASLSIRIWPKSDYFERYEDDDTPTFHDDAVAIEIGGKDGLLNKSQAGVQIRPGMEADFQLSLRRTQYGPASSRLTTTLKDILAGVVWASDPGSENTWPEVTAWAK